MLPYLEQTNLYNAANFSVTAVAIQPGVAMNSTAFNTNLAAFICPSDGLAAQSGSWANSNNNYYGSIGRRRFRMAKPAPASSTRAKPSSTQRPPTRTPTH